jgi:hypothetical protein
MFLEAGRRVTDLALPIAPPTGQEIERLLAIAPRYGIEFNLVH